MMHPPVSEILPGHQVTQDVDTVGAVARFLLSEDLAVAPHVAARLHALLDGDVAAIVEVASAISPAQRSGACFLPNPLPLVPAITARFRDVSLMPWEHELLLAASVCVDDQIDVLLTFTGRPIDDLVAGVLPSWLSLVAGHYSWADPLMRIWVHQSATLAERTKVHRELCAAYEAFGDMERATWHRALATLEGDAHLVPDLLVIAQQAFGAGECEWAFAVAREAAAHACDENLARARLIAGSAALGAGCVDEAVEWLNAGYESGTDDQRARTLARLITARTFVSGARPVHDLERFRPTSRDPRQCQAWAHAAALVAALAAERGALQSAREWIAHAREAMESAQVGEHLPAATAWVRLLAGEDREPEVSGAGPLSGAVYLAMRDAIDGDIDGGLQRLTAIGSIQSDGRDSLAIGFERTPVVLAYRAVAEALLRLWSGDVRAARATLLGAALQYPVGIPFDGLASTMAGRLESATSGRSSVFADSLTAVRSKPHPSDTLVERGINEYLRGDVDSAGLHLKLWSERRAPSDCFGLPGLDEVGPLDEPTAPEPQDIRRARRLRRRLRAVTARGWEADLRDVAAESSAIASTFERARVECMLGSAYALRGDRSAGARHLLAAESLFADSGAQAWERASHTRLAVLGGHGEDARNGHRHARGVIASGDPLASCRITWEPLLTPRELDVAMLVAEAASNRAIAARLMVSVRTVEVHIGRLFAKLGVHSRSELTALAYRTSLHA